MVEAFDVVDLIHTKRDGGALSTAQISWLIDAYTRGYVGDVAAGVGVDEPVDLLGGEGSAIALGADQVDDIKLFDGHCWYFLAGGSTRGAARYGAA